MDPRAEEALIINARQYNPQWVLVPPQLIGEPIGKTANDIPFDPYGLSSASADSSYAFRYENPFNAAIPAGSDYYSIRGYDSKTYLALENGGNYYLYASSSRARIVFPIGKTDAELITQLAGTFEQAYCTAFMLVAPTHVDYIVLDILAVDKVDVDDLLALIVQYCYQEGITLLVTSYSAVKDNGYLNFGFGNQSDWSFKNGVFVSLKQLKIDGESATIETGITFAPLYGHGDELYLEKVDGWWVITGGSPLWIS